MSKPKPWTEEEISVLRRDYDGSAEQTRRIAAELGRGVGAVQVRAHKLGIATARRFWTGAELDLLMEHYDGTNEQTEWLMNELDRTRAAIHARAVKLKITGRHNWTLKEDDLIEAHYTKLGGIDFLERRLKRSRDAIKIRAGILGLNFAQQGVKKPATRGEGAHEQET
mgnify:CR=1 FL=1